MIKLIAEINMTATKRALDGLARCSTTLWPPPGSKDGLYEIYPAAHGLPTTLVYSVRTYLFLFTFVTIYR